MTLEIERPAAVGAAHGPESKALLDEQRQYAPDDSASQDHPREIYRRASAVPGSSLRALRPFTLPPPPPMGKGIGLIDSQFGRKLHAIRDLGFIGSDNGSLLVPLFQRDIGLLELLHRDQWPTVYAPRPVEDRLGLACLSDLSLQPDIETLLEIGSAGEHRIIGNDGVAIHSCSRWIEGQLVIDVRLNATEWLLDFVLDDVTDSDQTRLHPTSVLATTRTTRDVREFAELLAWEPHLEAIRILDTSARARRFGMTLIDAIACTPMRRRPEVLFAEIAGGGA